MSSPRPGATASSRRSKPRRARSTSLSTTLACRGARRSTSTPTNNDRLHVPADALITLGRCSNSFPEKEGWDRLFALNVKSMFYGPCHPLIFMRPTNLERPVTVGFTPLLAKDATNHDSARVINISSVAGLSPIASGTKLSSSSNGLWSCLSCPRFPFHEY